MKAILIIDMPEVCLLCPCADVRCRVCNWTCAAILRGTQFTRNPNCPLIPLTEYEEARINEILKERETEK